MDSEDICLSVFLCICADEGMEFRNKLSVPSRTCWRGYRSQKQAICTQQNLLTRVWNSETSYLYPTELVGEGIEVRNKLSVPSRTCESGYVRQNQVDYTHRLSRTRVCEIKSGRIYPSAFADAGM